MKKAFKKIFVILLVIIISFSIVSNVAADTIYYSYGYLYSDINNYMVSLRGWNGDSTVLSVPRTINGKAVVDISNLAFKEQTDLTAVEFLDAANLERIGSYAFAGCSNISGVLSFPRRLSTIEKAAFQDCILIESVVINSNLSEIPDQCFYGCTSLNSVSLNPRLQRIGYLAFADCPGLNYVEIPASVTVIENTAFQNDTDITLGVYYNSAAHQYAESKGITFEILDPENIPEEPTEPEPPTEAPVTEAPATEAPVTEAPATEAPVTEKPQGYFLGDVDGNGSVEMIDATTIQRFLALMKIPETCVIGHGDVDGDGVLTIIDVSVLRRHFAQFEQPYPIGEWVEQS